jgi:hypothetical protein
MPGARRRKTLPGDQLGDGGQPSLPVVRGIPPNPVMTTGSRSDQWRDLVSATPPQSETNHPSWFGTTASRDRTNTSPTRKF